MEWLTLEEFKAKEPDGDWCWITFRSGSVDMAYYIDEAFHYSDVDYRVFDDKDITHVMPIPKPEAP